MMILVTDRPYYSITANSVPTTTLLLKTGETTTSKVPHSTQNSLHLLYFVSFYWFIICCVYLITRILTVYVRHTSPPNKHLSANHLISYRCIHCTKLHYFTTITISPLQHITIVVVVVVISIIKQSIMAASSNTDSPIPLLSFYHSKYYSPPFYPSPPHQTYEYAPSCSVHEDETTILPSMIEIEY